MRQVYIIFLILLLTLIAIPPQIEAKTKVAKLKYVTQKLVPPPFLPKHRQVAKGAPKVVRVRMVIEEKEVDIGNGVKLQARTIRTRTRTHDCRPPRGLRRIDSSQSKIEFITTQY